MTGQGAVVRHGYSIVVAFLLLGIVVLAGFLLLVALPDVLGTPSSWFSGGGAVAPAPTPTASPAPSASPASAMSPIGIEMPADSNCAACHVTATGTVGTKPIPNLAHPLWGFRDCTACHSNDSLVKTAPGHSGLHKADCLVCHEVPENLEAGTSVGPMRPEHMGQDKACTDCHGVDEHAPLPESMAGRDNCWVCHNGSEFTYLFESPDVPPGASAAPDASPGSSPEAFSGTRYVLSPRP